MWMTRPFLRRGVSVPQRNIELTLAYRAGLDRNAHSVRCLLHDKVLDLET
jgi:hypothetical protein